jgi:hypothetical protein
MRRIKVKPSTSPFVRRVLQNPLEFLDSPHSTILRRTGKTTTALITSPKGENIFLKVRNTNKLHRRLYTPIFREHRLSDIVSRMGIPVPKSLGASSRRKFGILQESALVTEYIPNSKSVEEYLKENAEYFRAPNGRKNKCVLITRLAELYADAHSKGMEFVRPGLDDIIIQVDEHKQPLIFVDLERVKIHRRPVSGGRLLHDLYRLNYIIDWGAKTGRGIPEGVITEADKIMFWRKYLRKRPGLDIDESKFLNEILKRTQKKLKRRGAT